MRSYILDRLDELAMRAYAENKNFYTDFLSEAERAEILAHARDFEYAGLTLFGGREGAERQIARLGKAPFGTEFPVACLKISPLSQKFAVHVSHRDFLGSLLALGLERKAIGDILVKENVGYCFCLTRLADYIVDELKSVGKNPVKVVKEERPPEILSERKQEIFVVSSLRCDCFVSEVYNLSRAESLEYFRSELVYLNGKTCTENAKELKENDCVSVRGKGKFYFEKVLSRTQKDKYRVEVSLPV